jgi:repressor LexA
MSDLTPRQGSFLEFLRRYIRDRGYPPTIREIRDAFQLRSNRGVIDHLRALERKGYIKRVPGSSRAIEITGGIKGSGEDARFFGERGDFALEVKGDGMIGDHIVPGYLVVVRKTDECESGSLVVALVDGEATVKRFIRAGGRIILQPANANYEPIILSAGDSPECAIVGTVVGVVRSLAPRRGAFSG